MKRCITFVGLVSLIALSQAAKADQHEKLQPQRARAVKAVVSKAGSGLIGSAKVAGRDSDILFQYVHGKVFNPEPVRSRIDGDFVLTLRGRLQVPRDMVVKAWHAGGGVSHDVNTLFVDDRKISSAEHINRIGTSSFRHLRNHGVRHPVDVGILVCIFWR